MNIYFIINELFNDILEPIIILLFLATLTGNKPLISKNKIRSALYVFVQAVSIFFITLYIPRGIHAIINIIVICTLIIIFFKGSIWGSMMTVAVVFIYLFSIEATFLLIYYLFEVDANIVNNILILILTMIALLIKISGAIVLYRRGYILPNFNFSYMNSSRLLFLVYQVFLFTILVSALYISFETLHNIFLFKVLILIIFLLAVIISFFDFRQREKIIKMNYKLTMEKEYVNNLEQLISMLRKNRHDIKNHLITINSLSKVKSIDSLDKIAGYISNISDSYASSVRFYNTGNYYIDGLLAVKNNAAFEKDINLKVDFEHKLTEVKVDSSVLVSIIGNITDNAIEAVKSNIQRGKSISISGYIEDNLYKLSICNNGWQIPEKDINRIFDSKYSTKKENKENHGFGLYIVKQHVERSNGRITVSSSEAMTEFLIEFPLKKDNIKREVVHDKSSDSRRRYPSAG